MKVELPSDREERKEILDLPFEERVEYTHLLFDELFVDTWNQLVKWTEVTGQTPQPDSGYIAQHLISLLSGVEGSGMRGKGDDLADGSEVKTASAISGVDVPRWNHSVSSEEKLEEWFNLPNVFYVLIDWTGNNLMRVRVWRVQPPDDENYRTLLQDWFDMDYSSSNFQLHPPVGSKGNKVTKDVGDLLLPLKFEMIVRDNEIDVTKAILNPGKSQLTQQKLTD